MHVAGDDQGTVEMSSTRVLVVDDDPSVVDLATQYIEHDLELVSVRAETDPRDAIDVLRSGGVDCVVCDYSMPDIDGLEVLDVVERETEKTTFILFTGSADETVLDRVDDDAVDRFIRKGETNAFGRLSAAIDDLR
ncbi:MAG: response regulator [Halococcoides sp.]